MSLVAAVVAVVASARVVAAAFGFVDAAAPLEQRRQHEVAQLGEFLSAAFKGVGGAHGAGQDPLQPRGLGVRKLPLLEPGFQSGYRGVPERGVWFV